MMVQEMKTSPGSDNMPRNPWKDPNNYISDALSYVYKMFNLYFLVLLVVCGVGGGTVVKVLCYNSEGHWFDPRWCHLNFLLT